MIATLQKPIVEQLYDIWLETPWQVKVPKEHIINYYVNMLASGGIYTIDSDGELLGYYERRFEGYTCFLVNVWVKEKGIFKQLYRHFFDTMPLWIKYVTGDKQKLKGKRVMEIISNARR